MHGYPAPFEAKFLISRLGMIDGVDLAVTLFVEIKRLDAERARQSSLRQNDCRTQNLN